MQRIGVKQFLILKICCDKGYVWSGDVVDIYDIHLTPRSGKRAIIQLKKLEAYGYIKQDYETVGSCAGHGRYPLSILYKTNYNEIYELISGVKIPRKRNFYVRDKDGFYYIPEALEALYEEQ